MNVRQPSEDTSVPDDEITFDPEATSAADSDWLAALRTTARERKQSLADVIDADDDASDDPGNDRGNDPGDTPLDVDDEATVGGSAEALAAIRAAVDAARSTEPALPNAATDTATNMATSIPIVPAAAPVQPAIEASTPAPAPVESRPAARELPNEVGPRWEPPPRLSTAQSPVAPTIRLGPDTSRTLDWRIAAAAVVAALVIGFFIAQILTGGSGPSPIDPDGTVVDEDITVVSSGGGG